MNDEKKYKVEEKKTHVNHIVVQQRCSVPWELWITFFFFVLNSEIAN